MNKFATDITILLDRSGSMQKVADDTIGGYNTFLAEQKKVPGEVTITLVQFDHDYLPVHVARPIKHVLPLTSSTYVPRGSTALYDAACRAIDDTGARLAAMPDHERPGLVVFVIITDALDNSSQHFGYSNVQARIRLQSEVYRWQFVYLGADHDAIEQASMIGVDTAKAMHYASNKKGTAAAYQALGQNLNSVRARVADGQPVLVASAGLNWSGDQLDTQKDELDKSYTFEDDFEKVTP